MNLKFDKSFLKSVEIKDAALKRKIADAIDDVEAAKELIGIEVEQPDVVTSSSWPTEGKFIGASPNPYFSPSVSTFTSRRNPVWGVWLKMLSHVHPFS